MMSLGRGRGLRIVREEAKVGHKFHDYWEDKPVDGEDVLVGLLDKLNIDGADEKNQKNEELVKKIIRTMKDLCDTSDSLRMTVASLHSKSIENEIFGRKTALVLGSLSQL